MRTVLSWAALLVVAGAAPAQLPHARLDRLFPLGGAAGRAVEVEVQGRHLDELTALRFDHPGIRAEPLKGPRLEDWKRNVEPVVGVREGAPYRGG